MDSVKRRFNKLRLQFREAVRPAADGLILIHINKTGGSSIEKAFDMPLEHKTAQEKIVQLGRAKWDSCFSFAVVRNPWDKVVSHYHYRVQTNQTGLADQHIDFKQWVKLCYSEQNPAYYDKPKMFQPQTDWLEDESGKIVVNFICRFENLAEDFATLCSKIDRSVELPHVKTSSRGHYRDYYDQETTAIIERWFKSDITLFGYHF